jgi:hypothetical protein
MKRKNILSGIAAISAVAMITGCSSSDSGKGAAETYDMNYATSVSVSESEMLESESAEAESEDETDTETAEQVTDTEDERDAETSEEDTSEDETSEASYVIVPDVEVNTFTDDDFTKVTINGVEVNINDYTLADIVEATGIERCTYGSTFIQDGYFEFSGGMYGIKSYELDPLSFEGTMVTFEVLNNGVIDDNPRTDEYANCLIKGVRSSQFFTEDDFEVIYYGGITSGTLQDDIVALLGEGEEYGDYTVYNNGKQTLMIEYEADWDSDGFPWVADEIILLINDDD